MVGQLDVESAAMNRRHAGVALCLWIVLGVVPASRLVEAHVGSADTFFSGKAGAYDVRVSVRLPGVIPGRAQVAIRVVGATTANSHRVSVQAGQWNVGLKGAPPPERATAVAGDPELYAAELWFMTPSSYQLAVHVDGSAGAGTAIVPVMALATETRTMPPWLGGVLAALGAFLTVGFLTIVGSAVRESVLPPGVEPDARRRWRARIGVAVTGVLAVLLLWGGNVWWAAEANAYMNQVLYRPFAATAAVNDIADGQRLSFSIRDPRWTGKPNPLSRYNTLLPDHGKLMHLFLIREPALDALAHLHPVARTPEALDFDTALPTLPAGRYRALADIVHESGYAQTLVSHLEVPDSAATGASDPDDSSFTGKAVTEASTASFDFDDGSRVTWMRGEGPRVAGEERVLEFKLTDGTGSVLDVQPYMGMAAHSIVASRDGSVFAHLHPSGSISMAALTKFTAGRPDGGHAGHEGQVPGAVAIPFAFPRPGPYRVWVQVKRDGRVRTAAFEAAVGERP
jgi:hypothetical protein